VILYADQVTGSIDQAMKEIARRRTLQIEFNEKNGITPRTIVKPVKDREIDIKDIKHIPKREIPNLIIELSTKMEEAAESLDFERAIVLRDRIREMERRVGKVGG
jgi:excinuclease ABC subunit B